MCAALKLLPYAFDLLMLNGDDLRRRPFAERKAALCRTLQRTRRTSGMSRTEGRFGDATAMRPTARARSFRLRKNCFGQLRSRNTSTCGTRRFVDRSRAYRMVRSARDASGCHIDGRNAGRPEDRGRRLTTTTWMVRSLQCRRGAFRGTIEKRQRPASIQMGSLTVGRTCPRVISECKNRIDQMISRTSSRSAGYLFQSRVVHRSLL
jgi:hypothetical protein